jgi:hypothetical protein
MLNVTLYTVLSMQGRGRRATPIEFNADSSPN